MNTEKNLHDIRKYKFSLNQKDLMKQIISGYCNDVIQSDNFINEFEDGVLYYVAEFGSQIPFSEKECIKQLEDLSKTLEKLSSQLSNLDLLNSIFINNNFLRRQRSNISLDSLLWQEKLSIRSIKIAIACKETLIDKKSQKLNLLEPEGLIVQAIENASKKYCPNIKIKDGTDSIAVKLVQVIKDDFCFKKTAQRVVTRYLKHHIKNNIGDTKNFSSVKNKINQNEKSQAFKDIQNKFLYKKN